MIRRDYFALISDDLVVARMIIRRRPLIDETVLRAQVNVVIQRVRDRLSAVDGDVLRAVLGEHAEKTQLGCFHLVGNLRDERDIFRSESPSCTYLSLLEQIDHQSETSAQVSRASHEHLRRNQRIAGIDTRQSFGELAIDEHGIASGTFVRVDVIETWKKKHG